MAKDEAGTHLLLPELRQPVHVIPDFAGHESVRLRDARSNTQQQDDMAAAAGNDDAHFSAFLADLAECLDEHFERSAEHLGSLGVLLLLQQRFAQGELILGAG
jgi:hypothetical protein